MRAMRVIIVLFVAMALVSIGSVATAMVRIDAADRSERGAQALRDRAAQAERELRAAREQAVDVTVGSMSSALGALGTDAIDLPLAECVNFWQCDAFRTATVSLTGCDGQPLCVRVGNWTGRNPAPMSLAGETWTAEGEMPKGELICEGVDMPGSWRFTATVVDARYSIADGWQPHTLAASIQVQSPATKECGGTTLRWAGNATVS